jgi:hypothetical protein
MNKADYEAEKAKLTMDWRKSILDVLNSLAEKTHGDGVSGMEMAEAEYNYRMAKLDYEYAVSNGGIDK